MFTVKKILVPVDYSEVSRAAVSAAMQLASQNQAELVLLHVQPDLDATLSRRVDNHDLHNLIAGDIESEERRLVEVVASEQARATAAGRGLPEIAVSAYISGGDWLEVALKVIADEEIDLVVSGTHGPRGIKGFLMGSMSEQLVSKATCSVFVVKPKGYPYLRD